MYKRNRKANTRAAIRKLLLLPTYITLLIRKKNQSLAPNQTLERRQKTRWSKIFSRDLFRFLCSRLYLIIIHTCVDIWYI